MGQAKNIENQVAHIIYIHTCNTACVCVLKRYKYIYTYIYIRTYTVRITILEWVSCFVPGAGSTCDEVPEDASAFLSKLDVESGQRILPDVFVTVQAFPGDVLDKKRWG